MRFNKVIKTGAIALITALSLGTGANAAIISASGDVLDSNGDIRYGANDYNDHRPSLIRYWDEAQNVSLEKGVIVDINVPGTYSKPFASANANVGAFMDVSSHYINFDPKKSRTRSGSFTFDGEIIGIQVLTETLYDADLLFCAINCGSIEPQSNNKKSRLRGLEFGPEIVTFNIDLFTLDITLKASSPGDQIRVITKAVPEPAALGLMGLGLLGMAGLIRRRRG